MGISTKVNDVIFDLMSRNYITSSTLIANGPAIDYAVKRIPQYSKCSFGIHLNITQFRPIMYTPALKDILDENGNFRNNIYDISISPSLRQAIFLEWRAQIKKIQSYGVKISHIDSHNHVHTIPKLFVVLKRVQKKCGIRKVRITKNLYSPSMPCASKGLLIKKFVWIFFMKHYYPTVTTSCFTDLSSFVEVVKMSKLTHKKVEIMVHPGNEQFREEMSLLKSDWLSKISFNYELKNYNEL